MNIFVLALSTNNKPLFIFISIVIGFLLSLLIVKLIDKVKFKDIFKSGNRLSIIFLGAIIIAMILFFIFTKVLK